jgi:methionine-rich copper-binding protein CopC
MLQNQLTEAKTNLNAVTDSIAVLDVKILEQQIGNESARELGPLKYMAKLTGRPMEQIVNWFMLLIIFVFDPLAIAMVVAANMAFAHIKGVAKDPKDYEVYKKKPKIVIKEIPVEVEKIVEKEVIKEVPVEKEVIKEVPSEKIPKELKGAIQEAFKHAKRRGIKIPDNPDRFFEN